MKIKIKNDEPQWMDIVGKEFTHNNIRVVCSSFESECLYINEWIGKEVTGRTSVISTVDKDRCLAHLEIFGYKIELIEMFVYSEMTLKKIEGLIQAGFTKFIREGDNYMVDGIFRQNILSDEELQHLLKSNITEINLLEIE
ncbi:MAG: hypothetical protein ACRC92_15545 [Peptostreptococcaceae bacterium]